MKSDRGQDDVVLFTPQSTKKRTFGHLLGKLLVEVNNCQNFTEINCVDIVSILVQCTVTKLRIYNYAI